MPPKVALITGAARRIGATIAKTLHQAEMNIIIHYRNSASEATQLCDELNAIRANSCALLQADLNQIALISAVAKQAFNYWQRLDLLINNASSFYPTSMGSVTEQQWDDLLNSNLKGPFFLSQACIPFLATQQGSIINIVDIHSLRPLRAHPVYSIAKAGLRMLTKALAKELGPDIKVNAVAPGAILWPEHENALDEKLKQKIIDRTALKRLMNKDIIYIRNLRINTLVGIQPWEERLKQEVVIDVEVSIDIHKAAESSNIADTVDYALLAEGLTKFIGETRFKLVEVMAEQTANYILHQFNVSWLRLRIAKPQAVANADEVGVCIERVRGMTG